MNWTLVEKRLRLSFEMIFNRIDSRALPLPLKPPDQI
jgi:hypothetical protein